MAEHESYPVLIVDDDPAALALLRRHLGCTCRKVYEAGNGAEALEIIKAEAPPLVITDWSMPEMDGLQLCREIRSEAGEGIGFIYVIVVTAHTEQDRVVSAFEAGADDYLTKPINPKELVARLRAGERIIRLQEELEKRTREVYRFNAEMAITQDKLEDANDKLTRLATTDELTGLINRRETMRRLTEAWAVAERRGMPLSCIGLDIDHFKNFNDTWGHAFGDTVLRETALTIKTTIRAGSVACRIGGEEFLVICPDADIDGAAKAAERIRAAVAANRIVGGNQRVNVTISLGVAERVDSMEGPDDLLKAADDALYNAKRAGRNRVCLAQLDEADASGDSAGAKAEAPTDRCDMPAEAPPFVLLVDADPQTRQTHRAALEAAHCQVRELTDVQHIVEMVQDRRPDVVVMPYRSPGIDGLKATAQLKAHPQSQDVPVLMVGASWGAADMFSSLQAGAHEYLARPFKPEELSLRVKALARLEQSRKGLVRLHDLRSEHTRMVILLLDYSHALAAAQSLEGILECTASAAVEMTCSRRVSIMLPDDQRQYLRVVHAVGMDGHLARQVRVPIGGRLAGRVFQTRQALVESQPGAEWGSSPSYQNAIFASLPLVSSGISASEVVVGVLNVTDRQENRPFTSAEVECLNLLCSLAGCAIHDVLNRQAREDARDSIVIALAQLAEHRDSDTGKHLDRVTQFCVLLAQKLRERERYAREIDREFIHSLVRAVPLHDIGKVAIPDHILLKPGKLTEDEMVIMRTHTEVGTRTIQSIIHRAPGAAFLRMAADIAGGHHEHFNGKGYPAGLVGEQIPLSARIAALADVYDALTSVRCYKPAMPHDKAKRIIVEGRGSQFDPDIVDAFLELEQQFADLARELSDSAEEQAACATPTHAPTAAPPPLAAPVGNP